MIKSKKMRRERLAQIVSRLKDIYPEAPCALEYRGDPWKLLVMARLSAQCTDKRVNIVSEKLFDRYPMPKSLAEADLSEVEEIIRPCGLYKKKAESIVLSSQKLIEDYQGELPSEMDKLLEFSGVGRKIANLLIGDIFGGGAIVCDTHFMRICGRLGMYKEGLKDATRVEFIMRDLMDISEGSEFCHRIVIFGREICSARNPACHLCPIKDLCHSYESKLKTKEKKV